MGQADFLKAADLAEACDFELDQADWCDSEGHHATALYNRIQAAELRFLELRALRGVGPGEP